MKLDLSNYRFSCWGISRINGYRYGGKSYRFGLWIDAGRYTLRVLIGGR